MERVAELWTLDRWHERRAHGPSVPLSRNWLAPGEAVPRINEALDIKASKNSTE